MARASEELGKIVADVAKREFGEGVGQRIAEPLGDVLTSVFSGTTVAALTGGDSNPLTAFAADAAWMIVAHTMNPRKVDLPDGRKIDIPDAAWAGFVLGMQDEIKERAAMADDDKDDKKKKKKKDKEKKGEKKKEPAKPSAPANPLADLVTKQVMELVGDAEGFRKAAHGIDERAKGTQRAARAVERIDNRGREKGFFTWLRSLFV